MRIRKSLLIEASKDRPDGYLEDVYSLVESEDSDFVYLSEENYLRLKKKYSPSGGPGSELAKLISWFYVESEPCNLCKQRIRQMDAWGSDLCERKIGIITVWLEQAAKKRNIPFFKMAATLLIRKAIANARRNSGGDNRTSA